MTQSPPRKPAQPGLRHVRFEQSLVDYDQAVQRMDQALFRQARQSVEANRLEVEELQRTRPRDRIVPLIGEYGRRKLIENGIDPGPPIPSAWEWDAQLLRKYGELHKEKYGEPFRPGLAEVEPTPEEQTYIDYWRKEWDKQREADEKEQEAQWKRSKGNANPGCEPHSSPSSES